MIQIRLHPLQFFSLGESILKIVVIAILSLENMEKKKREERGKAANNFILWNLIDKRSARTGTSNVKNVIFSSKKSFFAVNEVLFSTR